MTEAQISNIWNALDALSRRIDRLNERLRPIESMLELETE